MSFLTYRVCSFTNGVNKSPGNFLILFPLSDLQNKCFLEKLVSQDLINNYILNKKYGNLNLIPEIN